MYRRSGCNREETRAAAGSGSGSSGDRMTALPLELRAQIASLLSFDETVRLTVLSRAWRHIHLHTRVVQINLVGVGRGFLDEDKILGVRDALGRRTLEPSCSKVDTLWLISNIDNHRMRHHFARIITLADPRVIDLTTTSSGSGHAWSLDLPPAARDLTVFPRNSLPPTIAGPGAPALRKLRLDYTVLREWPHLPSLVSMDLNGVTVEAPFALGAWCPLLEQLSLSSCDIRQARVDIRLPRLRFLLMNN